LPSLHAVPFGFAGLLQRPVAGLQLPASWHWSGAGQTTAFDPTHEPAAHVSAFVHALPSSHAVPSALFGLLHTPDAGSHTPASWQESSAAHTTGLAPLQAPAWQVSLLVQPSKSLQAEPLALFGLLHEPVCESQTPES
jgi:hypothetical protein